MNAVREAINRVCFICTYPDCVDECELNQTPQPRGKPKPDLLADKGERDRRAYYAAYDAAHKKHKSAMAKARYQAKKLAQIKNAVPRNG